MKNLIQNESINFQYNPFGGLALNEIPKALVPIDHFNQIQANIENEKIKIIELKGKKGRGKSCHLKALQLTNPESAFFQLGQKQTNFEEIINSSKQLLFLDSIHYLNFIQRQKLFKSDHKIILTAHFSRHIEYKLAGAKSSSFNFSGISQDKLAGIIKNRIKIASGFEGPINLDQNVLKNLITKHGDDYRSIINHLYQNFDQC